MTEFRCAFDSGMLKNIRERARLVFTMPLDAQDVWLSFFVGNEWASAGAVVAHNPAAKDLRAEVIGRIVKGKFVFESTNTYYDMTLNVDGSTSVWGWTLIIDIDGHECQLPLPRLHKNQGHGFFQISCQVRGIIEGIRRSYATVAPLFCRTLFDPRSVLAFIAGTPNDLPEAFTKPFFPEAARAWSMVTDNDPTMLKARSLRGILSYLVDARNRARRNGLPIGEVNIIAHGNRAQWIIRIEETSRFPDRIDSSVVERLALGTLPTDGTQGANHAVLPRPGPEDLDEQSVIVLRGCELAWNGKLLRSLFGLFGGRATVYGCYCVVKYRNNQETLLDEFNFSLPGTSHGAEQIKAQLLLKRDRVVEAKHGIDYSDYAPADWDELAATVSTNVEALVNRDVEVVTRRYAGKEDNPVNETSVLTESGDTKSQEELEALAKSLWTVDSTERKFDDYKWSKWTITKLSPRKPIDKEHYINATYRLDSVGTRTEYSYRRAVLDPQTKVPAISDFKNPRHFRAIQQGPESEHPAP